MKTITIRDLRQPWPEAEAALKLEKELLITRDSGPVARLVHVEQPTTKRERWNPEAHIKWLEKVWRGKQVSLVENYLLAEREDRASVRPCN